jgi:hypothetical protein
VHFWPVDYLAGSSESMFAVVATIEREFPVLPI